MTDLKTLSSSPAHSTNASNRRDTLSATTDSQLCFMNKRLTHLDDLNTSKVFESSSVIADIHCDDRSLHSACILWALETCYEIQKSQWFSCRWGKIPQNSYKEKNTLLQILYMTHAHGLTLHFTPLEWELVEPPGLLTFIQERFFACPWATEKKPSTDLGEKNSNTFVNIRTNNNHFYSIY